MKLRKSKNKKRSIHKRKPLCPAEKIVRIGSTLVDHDKSEIFLFSEDILINQLRRDGPKIETSFDSLCESDLIQLSRLLSKASGLLYTGLTIAVRENDELRVACAQLLMNASNSFGAAVAILRMGYVLQPGIIIRSLLEAVSTSLHLLQKPSDLSAYQNHTLQSTKTIKLAKEALPLFGSLYGHFSENFVHIGSLHKSIAPVREYTESHDALKVNLSSLRIAVWLLYVTAELAFNEVTKQPRYWYPVKNGYKYEPSEEERKWMDSFFGSHEGNRS